MTPPTRVIADPPSATVPTKARNAVRGLAMLAGLILVVGQLLGQWSIQVLSFTAAQGSPNPVIIVGGLVAEFTFPITLFALVTVMARIRALGVVAVTLAGVQTMALLGLAAVYLADISVSVSTFDPTSLVLLPITTVLSIIAVLVGRRRDDERWPPAQTAAVLIGLVATMLYSQYSTIAGAVLRAQSDTTALGLLADWAVPLAIVGVGLAARLHRWWPAAAAAGLLMVSIWLSSWPAMVLDGAMEVGFLGLAASFLVTRLAATAGCVAVAVTVWRRGRPR